MDEMSATREIRGQRNSWSEKFVVRRDCHFGNRDREVSVRASWLARPEADMPENEEHPELRPSVKCQSRLSVPSDHEFPDHEFPR
jgi:hypothetical protein